MAHNVEESRLTTTKPPPEDNLLSAIRDLRGALENVGDKISKLDTLLCQTMLATVTVEHKVNQLRDEFDQHVGEAAE